MSKKSQLAHFPDRKISETFLHFAEPLLAELGPNATTDQMEEVLKIAFTIWNAVVYDTVNGNTKFIEMVRHAMAQAPDLAARIDQLIVRKRRLFGDDHRLVGEFKLTRQNGEIRLRAEARDPTSTN
jgi:hypothetical protein